MATATKKKSDPRGALISIGALAMILAILVIVVTPGQQKDVNLISSNEGRTQGTVVQRLVSVSGSGTSQTSHVTWRVHYTTPEGRTLTTVLNDCNSKGPDGNEGDQVPVMYAKSNPKIGRVGNNLGDCLTMLRQYRIVGIVAGTIGLGCLIAALVVSRLRKARPTVTA
ncbi:MAG: DUF3592 domain-containing protein [Actinomycetota bacterium]